MIALKSEKVEYLRCFTCGEDRIEKNNSWIESGSFWDDSIRYREWTTPDGESLPSGHISHMNDGDSLTFVYTYYSHSIKGVSRMFTRIADSQPLSSGSDPYSGDWHEYEIVVKRSGNRLFLEGEKK